MRNTMLIILLCFTGVFCMAQTHGSQKEQMIADSIAVVQEIAKKQEKIQQVKDEMQKKKDVLMKEKHTQNKVLHDTAFIDSLRKASKDFSFVGTWRCSFDTEPVIFIFNKDGTWRGRVERKPNEDIAGTYTVTSDSLFMVGIETKKLNKPDSKKQEEKMYVAYLPVSCKEVWLFVPFLKEKAVLIKQK